ncbi:DsrE family protein [Pedobacter sp.]|uniref:DsrE family protein n=1 Tax=Pedobacter sp. TaxID=1411316 RepID=UPI003562DCA6
MNHIKMKYMKMKQILFAVMIIFGCTASVQAQSRLEANKNYVGAPAKKSMYRAIYQMDQGAPDIIKKAIRNINNLLEDPRLKGKIQIELVAFSGGTEAYKKGSEYEAALKALVDKGVLVVQCLNTLKERKIEKTELFDFIGYVPTGNGELVIRAADGWIIVKP